MTRTADKEKAILLRKGGKSYSEIKELLGVSKGTLSVWLRDIHLSAKQLRQVRDFNPRRIERYRETRRKQREARLELAYGKARHDIGEITPRELFIAGLYLYWGEGAKTTRHSILLANTDPAMMRAFLDWLDIVGIPRKSVRVKLHIYKDMNAKKEIRFWCKETGLSSKNFRPPYVKKSNLSSVTYKNGYGHGTCNVVFENARVWEYISMALKRIKELHARSSMVERPPYTRLVGGSSPSGRTK